MDGVSFPELPKDVTHVGLALSGGPDSMALYSLLKAWAHMKGVMLVTATVDHGLRPESSGEAATLEAFMVREGTAHQTLSLNLPRGTSQQKAREARYKALATFFCSEGIQNVFLAHHHDDQLETLLMRLRRGSGAFGLAGMQPKHWRLGIWWHRPLLGFPKAWLETYAKLKEVPIFWDPSNQDPRFERARVRLALAQHTFEERVQLERGFQLFKRSREALEESIWGYLQKPWVIFRAGAIEMEREAFEFLPRLHQIFMLKWLLEICGGGRRPLNTQDLGAVRQRWPQTQTLGGCVTRVSKQKISIVREWRRIQPEALKIGQRELIWDRRFFIHLSEKALAYPQLSVCPWGKCAGEGREREPYQSFPALYTGSTFLTAGEFPGPLMSCRFLNPF
jgi:tRNA(Ile)-lysidine synthase